MIQAKVVADSLGPQENRLITMEVVFPRIVLAEFNTHRMFSRNSASSRAIPHKKMVKRIQENPFIPIAFQKTHKGMQGTEYFKGEDADNLKLAWTNSMHEAIEAANIDHEMGLTKQLSNRKLETYMYHKVLVTSSQSGLENFYKLRCPQYNLHENDPNTVYRSKRNFIEDYSDPGFETLDWLDHNNSQAEIHIQALAEAMWDAQNASIPRPLLEDEWHVPYSGSMDRVAISNLVDKFCEVQPRSMGWLEDKIEEFARRIAVARCARLSYQTLGDNPVIDYEADLKLYDRLASSGHWSPFEHVAKAMTSHEYWKLSETRIFNGVVHTGYCRNFRGFIQLRSLVDKTIQA